MVHRKTLTILLVLLGAGAFALGPFLLVPRGQTTPESRSPEARKDAASDDLARFRSTFPVVEYSDQAVEDPQRKAKGQKWGNIRSVNPNITEDATEMIMRDWEVGLPALPTERSQIIVLGKVERATAFLSDNKASVYSEFEIQIDTIFKNESTLDLKPNGRIVAEREGGIVRFPMGVEKWLWVGGQAIPSVQKTYLFFLTFDFPYGPRQKDDVYILTAYQLDDGRVVPLDNPASGTHAIARQYRGKGKSDLLKDLKNAIATKPNPGGPNK